MLPASNMIAKNCQETESCVPPTTYFIRLIFKMCFRVIAGQNGAERKGTIHIEGCYAQGTYVLPQNNLLKHNSNSTGN